MDFPSLNIDEFTARFQYDPSQNRLGGDKNLSVFKAQDLKTGQTVVLQIYQGTGLNPKTFLQEAQKALKLDHENLVQYLDFMVLKVRNFFGEEELRLVSVHKYVAGITLRAWIDTQRNQTELNEILAGILKGLQYLHDGGMPHGNLVPRDIVLEEQATGLVPKMVNYGYVKLFQARKTSSGNLLLGTGEYMPPEKIAPQGRGAIRLNADFWALGVILFEILAGKSPFGSKREGHSLAHIFGQIMQAHLPDLIQNFPDPYREMVLACLDKDPQNRVQTAKELLDMLGWAKTALEDVKKAGLNAPKSSSDPIAQAPPIPTSLPDLPYFAKIILLGEASVGKSTFLRSLTGKDASLLHKKESGINIRPHTFQLEGKRVITHIWDFADNKINDSIHQIFFSSRCLYLLMWDSRKSDQDPLLEEWMNLINTYTEEARIILMVNRWEHAPCQVDAKRLQTHYPHISAYFEISALDEKAVPKVEREIQQQLRNLSYIREGLPDSWLAIQSELANIERDYIDYRNFRDLCKNHGLDQQETEELSLLLHDLGILLNYRQEGSSLQGTAILDPEWLTTGIYQILQARQLQSQQGIIPFGDLDLILDAETYPPEKHILFLELMHFYQMCFPIGEMRRFFLFPSCLPANAPKYFWPEKTEHSYRYQYKFFPNSLFPQFVAKTRNYTENTLIWQAGIVLQFQGIRAEVSFYPAEKAIDFRLSGEKKIPAMKALLEGKMEEVHAFYPHIQYRELIPCHCHHCRQAETPHYFQKKNLEIYQEQNYPQIVCLKSKQKVLVSPLMLSEAGAASLPIIEDASQVEVPQNDLTEILTQFNLKEGVQKILFVAANPLANAHLQLPEEYREIEQGLRKSKYRDHLKLIPKMAVRTQDFQQAILEHFPQIVHFSGHGTEAGSTFPADFLGRGSRALTRQDQDAGGLVLESDDGFPAIVSTEALKELFGLFKKWVKCVLLNACYSQNQAEAIAEHIDYVIGMRQPISDRAAIIFATSFYDAIGAGRPIEFAFDYGRSAIRMQGLGEADIPVLLKKNSP